MRRMSVVAVTALAALVAASAGYGATSTSAINTYTGAYKFTTKKAGTPKKPVPIGFTQDLTATGTNGNRTAILLDIKSKIYGLKMDGKDFPTCSFNFIANAKNDKNCPRKAEVATGYITAVLGPANNFAPNAKGVATCDPLLDVWNSGQGKLTYFFVDTPTHVCLGGALHTGSTGPFPATYKSQGKNLVIDLPVPSFIDFPLGKGPTNLVGSLETQHLVWFKRTTKVKGRTVASISSVGCQKGKRPYSTSFSATLSWTGLPAQPGGASNKAPCG